MGKVRGLFLQTLSFFNFQLSVYNCNLQIANTTLLDFSSEVQFDILYFDAFAAVHQPEMWNEEAIRHITTFLKSGGVLR